MPPRKKPLIHQLGSFFYDYGRDDEPLAAPTPPSSGGSPLDVEKGSSRSYRRRFSAPLVANKSLSPTVVLPLLNLIDMFAVSLVVPLLFQYYKRAGVTAAAQRELLSSLFSSAQIMGGLVMGVLNDAKLVQRKTLLYLSFGGSALSYGLIAFGGVYSLMISRVIVGLVKQTMTVSRTILTNLTTRQNRAQHMGRLTASTTVAWVVGPSAGALLFKYFDPRAPALLACALFLFNLLLAAILLKADQVNRNHHEESDQDESTTEEIKARKKHGLSLLISNLKAAFSSPALAAVVTTQLIFTFCTRATNYSQLGSFYEDMYGLEPHHRGYISSYQQLLQFCVQALLVKPILEWTGGERRTTCLLTFILAAAVYLESLRSLWFFLLVLCPIISLCFSMMNLSLQTLTTHVAPSASVFSALAALDVLQNAVSVSVPFYRTILFRHLSTDTHDGAMVGDPDPVAWIKTSALHWLVAAVVLWYLLLTRESMWNAVVTTSTPKKGK